MRTGTSHFQTQKQIERYCAIYGDDAAEALSEGRYVVGPPQCAPNQRLVTDADGRYYIEEKPTRVVFRVWKDGSETVIALFPDAVGCVPGLSDPRTWCDSFEHVGQHGAADYRNVMQNTRPAKPAEFAALKRELESTPYHYVLDIVSRR